MIRQPPRSGFTEIFEIKHVMKAAGVYHIITPPHEKKMGQIDKIVRALHSTTKYLQLMSGFFVMPATNAVSDRFLLCSELRSELSYLHRKLNKIGYEFMKLPRSYFGSN